jgi:outer membrane protein assembly factor BamB
MAACFCSFDSVTIVRMKHTFALFAAALVAFSQLPSALAADWPQWRGIHRDGKSGDTGLLKEWPEGGPKLLWKATGLGKGYAGIIVVGDRLYTVGDKDDASSLMALNADGSQVLWTTKVGKPGAPGWGGFAGPRGMPTVDGDLIFTVDQWGELVCVRASDGKEQWRKSFEKDFAASRPEWGFAESPFVDGDNLIVTPGGPNGAMVKLKKKTGEVVWQSKGVTDQTQYASIIAAPIGGARHYCQISMENVFGVSAADGAVLWKVTRKGKTAVIPTPIVEDEFVFYSSGYGVGCELYKVSGSGSSFSAEKVYANKNMANHHGGVVKVGPHLYGYSDGKGLVCQDFKTGEIVWAEKEKIKKGAVSFADGMLYCREEDSGRMILVVATPDGYQEKGQFAQPDRAKDKAWPHPTIANGKLYLRDQDLLLGYDVKGK